MKPNLTKKEVADTGVLNGVKVIVGDMLSINLNDESIKILPIHFSCNEKLKEEKDFYYVIINIQLVSCNLRNLALTGTIVIFKPLLF